MVEATLPLPQIISNERTRTCKGFRVSVLASWLAGDAMKMFWFFSATTEIPFAFKLCGIFQACCDMYLGYQYWTYGSGEEKYKDDVPLGGVAALSTSRAPMGTPKLETDIRF